MMEMMWLVIRVAVIMVWFVSPLIFISMIFITPSLDKFMSPTPHRESQWLVNRFTRFHRYGVRLLLRYREYPECPTALKLWTVFSTLMSITFTLSIIVMSIL